MVLADDQTLVRAGFRGLLDHSDDLEVVGEASNGAQAVEMVAATRPDIVLMDVRMPVLDGVKATAAIVERFPAVRVIVLTTFELDEYVFEALRAGATQNAVEPGGTFTYRFLAEQVGTFWYHTHQNPLEAIRRGL
ncbi:response regulator, partial [Micromonospora sp. M51]|uniref:response regulator n=1 Tax=Micromonospora sp. M51 TaxID=2824889 RepID=UPI001B38068F